MEMKINGETVNKALEAIANVSKTTANMTEKAKEPKKEKKTYREGDSQQHQQTVEVHVGSDQKEPPKPVVIKEKPETHIHKHFPDNRALTKDECDLEEKRLRLQFEADERERDYKRQMWLLEQRERKEREEYERKERMRKEEERRKQRKARNMVAGAVGAGFLGLVGYILYSDARAAKTAGNSALPACGCTEVINAEGQVK